MFHALEFFFYKYFYTDSTLKNWTLCQTAGSTTPTILDWSGVDSPQSPINQTYINPEDFCPQTFSSAVILPGTRDYVSAEDMCNKFRSNTHIFTDTVQNTFPPMNFQPIANFWSGYNLDIQTNKFVSKLDDGSRVDFDTLYPKLEWKWGEPNGRLVEQCGAIKKYNLTIMEDNSCGKWQYTTCMIKSKFYVYLQNAEELERKEIALVDKEFVPLFGFRNPEDFLLKGFSNHEIIREGEIWYLRETDGKTILYLHHPDIPLGLWHWRSLDKGDFVLNLNACNSSEFGCDDGSCLPRLVRCNHRIECKQVKVRAVINI